MHPFRRCEGAEPSTDLGHSSSHHSSNQLADNIEPRHHQVHASTQVDGNSEGRVKVRATGRRQRSNKDKVENKLN